MKPGVEFIDGIEMNRQHPKTFEIPDREVLDALVTPGNRIKGLYVKVGAHADNITGERFWCVIQELTPDLKLKVVVEQSDMLDHDEHGIHDGDTLIIEARHVLDHMTPAEMQAEREQLEADVDTSELPPDTETGVYPEEGGDNEDDD